MNAALDRVKREAHALSAAIVEEMFQNPFWEHRYRERASKHTNEDGLFHLQYLEQAYLANDVEIMVSYARWLRTVLVSRGMTTRHLKMNFAILSRKLSEMLGGEARNFVTILDAGERALQYIAGPARELQKHAFDIGEDARRMLSLNGSTWMQRPIGQPGIGAFDAVEDLLSYGADALAMNNGTLLSAYAHVLGELAGDPSDLLAALKTAIEQSAMSAESKHEAAAIFERSASR